MPFLPLKISDFSLKATLFHFFLITSGSHLQSKNTFFLSATSQFYFLSEFTTNFVHSLGKENLVSGALSRPSTILSSLPYVSVASSVPPHLFSTPLSYMSLAEEQQTYPSVKLLNKIPLRLLFPFLFLITFLILMMFLQKLSALLFLFPSKNQC